jgi:SAM-dependent methyltransferase
MAWRGNLPLQSTERILLGSLEVTDTPVLEAGVGQGRLLAALVEAGFASLHGFDLSWSALKAGRSNGPLKVALVTVQDARAVAYRDEVFRHVIYLQQLLSFMEDRSGRRSAASEAFRILQPGGTALFSFLSLPSRRATLPGWMLIVYIRMLRFATRRKSPISDLPWLKIGGRVNWSALFDQKPHAHYFTVDEAVALLRSAGFTNVRVAVRPEGQKPSTLNAIYLIGTKASGASAKAPADRGRAAPRRPSPDAPTTPPLRSERELLG